MRSAGIIRGKPRLRMRQLAPTFVAAAPKGARTGTSWRVAPEEDSVLRAVGVHLGGLAGSDLAARCQLRNGSKHLGRAERKAALTSDSSSRWAGTITRVSDDMWERQVLNYQDELQDKRAAVEAIQKKLDQPVGSKKGYPTKQEHFNKRRRLQSLSARVVELESRLESGHITIVRGGKHNLKTRHNLDAAEKSEEEWRAHWESSRWFLIADGDSQYEWGNGLISVNPDTGMVALTLPKPLRHLANNKLGRYSFSTPISFKHRSDEWAAQAATGSVRYDITYDAHKERWYVAVSWKVREMPQPSLDELRRRPTLAVDLNGDHLACWVVSPDGNPVGDPITIKYECSKSGGTNDASVRFAIWRLLGTAVEFGCESLAIENLNFRDARAVGREKMGRGKRGKRFRRTVASMPSANFRDRVLGMSHNVGLSVIVVDPAYTSVWGRKYWLGYLKSSRREPCRSHHAAAVVIGRRAMGLSAKRQSKRDGCTSAQQSMSRCSTASKQTRHDHGTKEPLNGNPLSAAAVRSGEKCHRPPFSSQGGCDDGTETRKRRLNLSGDQGIATVQDARPVVGV